MSARTFPRTYLLAAGVAAVGFFSTPLARAQISPDPLTGPMHGDDAIDGDDPIPPGDDGMRTQTSTRASAYELSPDPTLQETELRTEPASVTSVPGDTNIYIEDSGEEGSFYGSGLGLEAGGGVNEFAGGPIASMTETGGAWGARLTVGTRSPLAIEAAYIGSANPIQTLGLDRSTLMANGAEGALRLHLAMAQLNDSGSVLLKPYVLAGFAWKHYDLRGASENTSSVQDSDNVYEVPLGVGLSWNFGRFIADQRFDFRPSLSGDIVRDLNDQDGGSLNTWSLTGRVGVEF